MKDEMYGLGDLIIHFKLECKYMKDIHVEEITASHGTLVLRYIAKEKVDEETILRFEDEPIGVTTKDGKPVFFGVASSVTVHHENDYSEVILYATTRTLFADREKKTKTFQDQSKTIQTIAQGVKSYSISVDVEEDFVIDEMLSQENETDFDFLVRVSGSKGRQVIINSKSMGNEIHIGKLPFSVKELGYVVSHNSEKDILESENISKNSEDNIKPYQLEKQVLDIYDLSIGVGHSVLFDTREQMVTKSIIYAKQGYVYNKVYLTNKEGQISSSSQSMPPSISTSILSGKVEAVESTNVKVKFYGQNDQAVWMPYANAVSNYFYCMPDIGDDVFVYYQSGDSSKNVCLGSKHVNQSPDFDNYKDKILMANNRIIEFTGVETRLISNFNDACKYMQILFNNANGINIYGELPIVVDAKNDIKIQSVRDFNGMEEAQAKFATMSSAGNVLYNATGGVVDPPEPFSELVNDIGQNVKENLLAPLNIFSTMQAFGETFTPMVEEEPEEPVDEEVFEFGVVTIMALTSFNMQVGDSYIYIENGIINIKTPSFNILGSDRSQSFEHLEDANYTFMDMFLDGAQVLLDIVGALPIPGVATAANLINAGISLGRGDYFGAAMYGGMAALSCILGANSVVAGAKTVASAVKIGSKMVNAMDTIAKLVKAAKLIAEGAGMIDMGLNAIMSGKRIIDSIIDGTFDWNDPQSRQDVMMLFQVAGGVAESKVSNMGKKKGIDTSPSSKNNTSNKPTSMKDRMAGIASQAQHANDLRRNSKCANGEPVNMITGSFMIEQCDLIINDILGDYAIERLYESVSRQSMSPIGKGWVLSIFSNIDVYEDIVLVHMPDHTVESFSKTEDDYVSLRDGDETYMLSVIDERYALLDTRSQTSTYYYFDGRIDKVIDKFQNQRIYEYMGTTLRKIIFPSGQFLKLTFNGDKLVEMSDNINRKISYQYSGEYLTSVTIPNDGIESYEYNESGLISAVMNDKGSTFVRNEYDRKGRVTSQKLSTGQEYIILYDDANRTNTYLVPLSGKEIKYVYNHLSLMTKTIYQDGSYEEVKYDKWQNQSVVRDRMGNETFYEYNQNGLLLKEILPSGLITEFEYDDSYNLMKEWDSSGKEHTYIYDAKGCLVNSVAKVDELATLALSYRYDDKGRTLSVTDPNGNVETYRYETNFNKPTTYKTAEQCEIRYTYDDAGRCYRLSSERGTKEFAYDPMDIMRRVTDENLNKTDYTYDNMFNLTYVIPPNVSENSKAPMLGEHFVYDDFNNQVSARDGMGNVLATPRDLEGNIAKEINPNTYDSNTKDGVGISYEYDEYDRRTKTIYPDGSIERLKYDPNGNIIKRIQPEEYDLKLDDGKGFTYEYDSSNRLVQITAPNGVVTKRYVYDLKGNIIKEVDANGFKSAETDEERIGTIYQYNLMSWLMEKRTPIKIDDEKVAYSLVCYNYDNAGNMTAERRYISYQAIDTYEGEVHSILFHYDNDNRRTKVSDNTGAVMEYEYNSSNQVTLEKRKVNTNVYHTTNYIYDHAGRLIEVRVSTDEKDAVTKYEYDKNGNITKITTPSGNTILREYDLCDRIISETHKEKKGNIHNKTKFAYDKAGNLISIIDNQGRKTEIQYDLLNREIRTKEKDGSITRKFYDKNSNLSKVVRPNQYDELTDNGKGYSYTYNDKGQVLTIISPTGTILQSNTYDDNGNLITQVDGQNSGADFTYDLAGNRTLINTKGESSQSFEYDARGNIVGICDGEKNRTGYTLDKWGRITTITKADGSHEHYSYDYSGNMLSSTDGEGFKTEYEYTKTGQVSKIIDPMGEFESYAYDEENRLKRKVDRNGNVIDLAYNMYGNITSKTALNSDLFEKFTYSVDGMLKSAISNGMHYSYTYDVMNRLASKKSSGRTLIAYEYDNNGNITKEIDVVGNVKETSYNLLDKPTNICYNGRNIASYEYYDNGLKKSLTNGLITQNFGYDTDYNLTSFEVKNGSLLLADNHYKYDRNGNRTEKHTINGVTSYHYDNIGQLQEVNYPNYSEKLFYDKRGNRTSRMKNGAEELYSYDPRNRLTQLTKNGQTHSFEYDNAGNLKKDDKANYFYNEFNQTTKVETFDGNVQINRYDAEGLRYEMEENNRLVQFIFNQNREVVAENSDNTWKNYIRTSELLFSSADHASTYYHYASDEMGSVTHITQGENVLNEYEYDVWGEVTHQRETIENRFKFNGQQLDPITGQYYLRARFYNPVIARFTQEDTYRGDGLNLYAYCRNNPVYYVDPTGHMTCPAGAIKLEQAKNKLAPNSKQYKDIQKQLDGYYRIENELGGSNGVIKYNELRRQGKSDREARNEVIAIYNNSLNRSEALNEVKKDLNIPKSQQPIKQEMEILRYENDNPVLDGNKQIVMTRNLTYEVTGMKDAAGQDINSVVVQDHSYGHFYHDGIGDQTSHFNVRPETNTDNGSVQGLKDHYYFWN